MESLYETELTDDTDQALKGQKSSTVVYPFGNFPVSTNILRITPELFGGLGIRDEGYEPITGKIRLIPRQIKNSQKMTTAMIFFTSRLIVNVSFH